MTCAQTRAANMLTGQESAYADYENVVSEVSSRPLWSWFFLKGTRPWRT
jgi:hypothetical protein